MQNCRFIGWSEEEEPAKETARGQRDRNQETDYSSARVTERNGWRWSLMLNAIEREAQS